MAKLLNNLSLNTPIAKIIELPDHYVINGQLYNKDSMTPIPLQFYPVQSSPNCEISLNQVAYVDGVFANNSIKNNIMIDNSNPSVAYYTTTGTYSGGNCCLHKSTTNSDGTVGDIIVDSYGSGDRDMLEPYSQDSEYVYCTLSRTYGTSSYGSICWYNKNTMKATSINSGSNGLKLLKDTDGNSYFYASDYSASTAYIYRFDKSTKKLVTVITEPNSGGFVADYKPSSFKSNGDFYLVKDGFTLGCSDHYMRYQKYNLDITKNQTSVENVTVDMSCYEKGEITLRDSKGCAATHDLIEYSENGENFITHLIYNKGTQYNHVSAQESAMYTYKIIDDLNWEMVSYIEFNPVVYRAVLPLFNGKIIAMASESGCHIYNWDSGFKKYVRTATYDSPTIAIGCDTSNNIYIHFKDGSVEMVSNVMPTTIYCDFKENTYDYKGEDIYTSVVLSTKNISGNYLNCNMQVQLFGNVRFTDNGTKTKIVSTSNTGAIEVPVTIGDTGILRTSAKMI